MKLREAIKGYILDSKIAPQTATHIHQKQQRLNRFADWLMPQGVTDLDEVTSNLVKGFVVYLQEYIMGDEEPRRRYRGQHLSALSITGYVRVVKSFFNWCEKEGLLDGRLSPIKRLPKIKVPEKVIEAFSQDDLQAVLQLCDTKTVIGLRNYAIVLLLVDTGIREAEICGLKLSDVHEDYIKVFGKYSKEREIGISPTTYKALWKYIHQFRKPKNETEQNVFLSASGRALHHKSLWYVINHLCQEAGVKDIRTSPHTLRHTFAKTWLVNGGDLFSLSRVLGHEDVQTTTRYLKDFKSQEARKNHTKHSPVEGWQLGKKRGGNNKKSD
jgi:site-specific recombinase XerD